jgi:hypothetical protein
LPTTITPLDADWKKIGGSKRGGHLSTLIKAGFIDIISCHH